MAAEKSFAAKLDRLFATKRKVGERELSYEAAAAEE